MKQKSFLVMLVSMFMVMSAFLRPAAAGGNEEKTAKLVVDYLVKARGVIAYNQKLINDSGKGDKGFTAQVYEAQLADDFKKMTGMDVRSLNAADPVEKVLAALHESAKETVTDAQAQINEAGKGFKGFSPAIFGKRVGDRFYKKTGITLKQTSIKNRAVYNKPDLFEKDVLAKFESKQLEGGKAYSQVAKVNGKEAVRYMFPLYISQLCLSCHGDPAGELDVAGRKKEGYKIGDLRGAISVIVPIK